jgi:threonine dehydrogenase-like Zn-dependent dehydrogenase
MPLATSGLDERDDPAIVEPTDAIVRLSAGCMCGSDLWPYRGFDTAPDPTTVGHEYCGTVEAVGNEVRTVRPGQFVVGSFFTSDNTCAICRAGYQSSCIHRTNMNEIGAQAEFVRARAGDQLVGFVNVATDGGAHAFLLDTTVHRDWQRRGIGRRVVTAAITEARTSGMTWLHVDYEPHLDNFYRGCGFRSTDAGLLHLT